MSQYNLDRIFQPRRVAVVGASESTGSIGNALMKNLIKGGFKGKLLPVNPKHDTVHGKKIGFQVTKHPGAEKEFELDISLESFVNR
jgi:acetyltransferase